MNHSKKAHRKRWKGKPFRLGKRIRIRRLRRYTKPNFWHYHSELVFSKIILRDPEILWLNEYAPNAVISYEKVPGHEVMPLYLKGEWNGMTHYVRFSKEDRSLALNFRLSWGHTPA